MSIKKYKFKLCPKCKDKLCAEFAKRNIKQFCTGNKVFCKAETYNNAEIKVMSNL